MPIAPSRLALLAALLLASCGGGGEVPPAPACGDGIAQAGEACDGADLGGQGCAGLGQGFVGGALACDPACQLVTTGCDRVPGSCGNGVVDGEEACDDGGTVDLDGCSATCQLERPDSGWFAPGGGIGECCGT